MKEIIIENKKIGNENPCFIIAEIGMNHNGDINLAKKIIDAAADCGVDAAKFQIFTTEKLVTKEAKTYGAVKDHLPEYQQDMYKKYELTKEQYKELKKYCEKRNVIFFASIWDEENADLLEEVGGNIFKISSMDITHLPLLEYVAKKNKPIILSAGMSTLEEVKEAVATITKHHNNLVLLHCISSYPAEIDKSNLKTIETLHKVFNFPVGYSDHTLGWLSAVAAVTLGAKVIEKHFTIDKKLPGVDHHLSMDPKEMKEMVDNIRLIEKGLGNGEKIITEAEMETRKLARRSIIAKVNIPLGTKITKDMLIIKRPGTGIPPKEINNIIGKISKINIKEDSLITKDMI